MDANVGVYFIFAKFIAKKNAVGLYFAIRGNFCNFAFKIKQITVQTNEKNNQQKHSNNIRNFHHRIFHNADNQLLSG